MRLPSTTTALVALVLVSLAGCGLQNANGYIAPAEPGTIKRVKSLEGVPLTVGSKDFTEQLILGNMMATVLQTAGADVTNRANVAGSKGVRSAVLADAIDLSPEYTGTGWMTYLGNEKPIKGEREQWQAVAKADKAKNGLIWLEPSPMNNTYAMALGPKATKKFGITKLSEMSKVPVEERTFCVEDEFYSRADGFKGMLKAYGLELGTSVPARNVLRLDTGVVYDATARGRCTFGEVFTTDGRIPALKLRVLEDDKQFFPMYNLTQVIHERTLEKYPEIGEIFAQINPKITNEVMLELNAKVDVEGEDPALVARDWLKAEGFVK